MAKEKWAFHVVAADGAESFGFPSQKAAEAARKEFLEEMPGLKASKVVRLIPGKKYWVVHVRIKQGEMKSFGFESQIEAMKFHRDLMDAEGGFDCASFPAQAELER